MSLTDANNIIEWFVLGAATITCLYHAILYTQQRDRFLLLYANYLFSLSLYLLFRRITGYDSFENKTATWAYIVDHPLILYMLFSYVLFITKALELNSETRIAKLSVNLFYATTIILFLIHIGKVWWTDEVAFDRTYFFYSKAVMVFFAFTGLLGAWYIRKNTFKRIIITGGLVFASLSVVSMISVYYEIPIFGLRDYQSYFIGCLLDILIFSSALGYRNSLLVQEKFQAQKLLTIESEKTKLLLKKQHDILQKENEAQENQMKLNRQLQDEVGASLSSVHVFADLASQVVESDPAKSKEYLSKISFQSQQLMDDIGDILWASNVREEDAHEALLTRIRNYSHEILSPHSIECSYKIHPGFYGLTIQSEVIKKIIIEIKKAMVGATKLSYKHLICHIEVVQGELKCSLSIE